MDKIVKKNKIALAIFSFNRPEYLEPVLKSIESNNNISDIDFYFFQDGYINKFSKKIKTEKELIEKCILIWEKSKIPNKTLVKQEYNVGIGISQFEAKVLLFEEMGYEEVMLFEDDLILSKNYIRLLRILLDQFKYEKSVGIVMCHGSEKRLESKDKAEKLYILRPGDIHMWGWAMWKDRWLKIKPDFLKYYKFIEKIDYKKRPTWEIINFYKKEGINLGYSSQDGAIHYSIFKNGLLIINTQVNRGKYIGEKGEHMTPDIFKNTYFPKTVLDEFKEDEVIKRFENFKKSEFTEYANKRYLEPNHLNTGPYELDFNLENSKNRKKNIISTFLNYIMGIKK
jgi:hypothetical protein